MTKPAVLLQYVLPHRLLSRVVLWATRWTFAPWKDFLISQVLRRYRVDLGEAEQPDPTAYRHFNAFFTRPLKAGARPPPDDPSAIACPADGRVSQSGRIEDGRILQAKGRDFSVADLLGDEAAARDYAGGSFLTVYLSPRDYHRVHMPLRGTLLETLHVPGRIFSVAPFAVEAIPNLFARNERLVCHFRHERGPFAVVLVGAMLVSGVETTWGGVEIPPYASRPVRKDYRQAGITLDRDAELGRFNMGSTVILLVPAAIGRIRSDFEPEQPVRVGEVAGQLELSQYVTPIDKL